MSNPTSVQHYYADAILASTEGHQLLTDVLISYFQSQICAAWASATGTAHEALVGPGAPVAVSGQAKTPTDARGLFGGVAQRKGAAGAAAPEDPDSGDTNVAAAPAVAFAEPGTRQVSEQLYPNLKVPQARIGARPADYAGDPFAEVAPFCVSANDLINPLPPSMFSGSGWEVFHPPPGSAELSSHAHYWYSSLPTSKLRVGLQVGAGDIGVYYLREPAADIGLGSAIECWVDDNYKGAVVIENAAQIGDSQPT